MKNKNIRIWTVIFLPLYLLGCSVSPVETLQDASQGKLKVVVTSTILMDLVAQIGGEEISLTGILQPGVDPHVYEPVPGDGRVLEMADLIVYNGYNLEPGIIKLMNSTGVKARKLAVGEVVKSLKLKTHRGETVPDPHVWGSVKNTMTMVNAIRDTLVELSDKDRQKFTQNAAQLDKELEKLDDWIKQQIQTIPPQNRKIVTSHDAFQYYANAYGMEVVGTLIGISTEEKPSAKTVKELVDIIVRADIPTVFTETTINPELMKTVAQEAGVELSTNQLYSDSLGVRGSGADSYIKMMKANTKTIVTGLTRVSQATYYDFEVLP
ncbi:metal ABC transporter substrate-binding protein [Cylindrospermopsis raciborskii CENA303]|uniref:Metal ABC transporter substrate-binding protein n=1 Tax=Cylindrospermopsis raciborskii CENA303 TaxID=1170769 RepID=A0A1X4G5U6_9CYAN|nr:metal ABC transporter substrate-binding protein [Cylindrospermopsis raciborskii]EFA73556.1 Periplasmic solute binding protein [Raphidiopsis brookii D9]OSO90016.1 metal ABC transporter substrate-binding protein [Cylindrospermopsis raciborskii CENA303]